MEDKDFLRMAIELAQRSMDLHQGGPFGAIVVQDGQIIGRGYNQVTARHDPTAHAEVVAIREACQNLGHFQLDDCIIYSSCQPCPMCLGAIYWARLKKLVYACSDEDAANAGFDDAFIYKELALPLNDRRLDATQLLRGEGRRVFEAWLLKEDKIKY